MMSGAMTDGFHLVIEALRLNGIETIYGVAGIPITDLARLAQQEGLHYFGFRHEQSAGHAAAIAGYLTQQPGVCLTVSGPGFLNGLVALANATTNCFPMILLSGSSDRAIVDLEQGDYEELDQMTAAKPFAKASFRVGYAVGAATARGGIVLAIEGDSAFGFSGMELETICRYRLPVVVLVMNNGGIYRGDVGNGPPSPTGFVAGARYDRLIEAFGGQGYHVEDPQALMQALQEALAARRPALINCVIDPLAGTESGHIQNLNPKSGLA
ncbi:thiamine pyrophosphate-binding protein [Sulfobacillus thermotolerans]|uniref:thiamine pyrophosphate-binding protein n=1 Tax=Sulfobacillus thermotolerans TaxID=338644 RepID=UPI0033691E10